MRVRNLTVMFTDMKGFTAETSRRSRKQLAMLLETHEKITREAVDENSGEVIKNLGDGFLAIFASSTNALLAAKRLQEHVRKYNLNVPDMTKFELKIAIASGDVIFKNDDVFGDPVNLASRVLTLAEPGQILFTQSVFLSMNKNEIPTAEVGERQLKGLAEPIRIYKVKQKGRFRIKSLFTETKDLFRRSFAIRYLRYAFVFIAIILFVGSFRNESHYEKIKGIETETSPTPQASDQAVVLVSPSPTTTSTQKSETILSTTSPSPISATNDGEGSQNTEESFLEKLLNNGKGQFKGLLKKLGIE